MRAVSVSLQTAFRLTCGSSQSAEYNPAGLLFFLSTSEGSGLIWCDTADTTLKAVRRPCWWLIQAQKTWWGLALCVYPCRHLNSEQLCGMTLGRVIRLNHLQRTMLMWERVEARLSMNPEKWLNTTTVYLRAVQFRCQFSDWWPADLSLARFNLKFELLSFCMFFKVMISGMGKPL